MYFFRYGKVHDVLLTTIEIQECLQITGRGCFLQAQVCRTKKDLKSESNAKEISDGLPFLEYELHRLLVNKLKAKGMNAIFGLKVFFIFNLLKIIFIIVFLNVGNISYRRQNDSIGGNWHGCIFNGSTGTDGSTYCTRKFIYKCGKIK